MTDAERTDSADDGAAATGSVRREWSEVDLPSEAVVELVAEATESDPLDVPVLHDSVDTDAIDALYTGDGEGEGLAEGVIVSFTFASFRVTIEGGAYVEVLPPD